MPESPERTDVRRMLEQAEQAASLGDLSTADELLGEIARVQEAGLGSLHPDLANTLNNRAIVAERTGRLNDAEAFYRRAVAIASASLPAGDPMAVASHQNLADFCAAHGLPLDRPAASAAPVAIAEPEKAVPAPPPARPAVAYSPPPVVSPPLPAPAPAGTRRSLAVLAIAIAVVVTVGLVAMRPWARREPPTPVATETPAAAQAVASSGPPAVAPPAASVRDERIPAQVATAEPARGERKAVAAPPDRPSSSPAAISLAAAELCQRFSPSGGNWECDPVGASAAPGALVLYTRVRSPRDTVVVHRWYRGDALRKSVNLTIRANTTEGYRTYSRQTVDDPASWRVEVRTLDGDLLFERRVSAR